MALEGHGERQQLAGIGRAAGDGAAGDEAERDRRRAGAEPALERDPVDEAEAVALGRREEREGAQRQMARVARQLGGAFALDLDAAAVRLVDDDLVPELERGRGAVERRAEVRGRRRRERVHGHPIASSTASSSAATTGASSCSAFDRAGVLEPVAGQDADRRLAVAGPELRQRREARRRGRLAEHALLLRQPVPGTAELVLRERHDLDPAGCDERRRRARRGRGSAIRIALAQRRRRARLPGRRRSARRALASSNRGGDRGHVAAAAVGQRDARPARAPSCSISSNDDASSGPRSGRGLSELTSTKPGRAAELAADAERVVEAAAQLDQPRAGGARLRALRGRRSRPRASARRRRVPPARRTRRRRRRCSRSTRRRRRSRRPRPPARPRRPCRGP